MRFLATGDIQAHNWKQFSYIRKDGMNSRLYNCLRIFQILKKEAGSRGINKILLNGDIIEENAYIETEVYDAVYRELEELYRDGLEIVINVGNHDILRQSGGRVLHTLRAFRRIAQVVEEPTLVWDRLQVVPWMEDPERFKKSLRKLHASRKFGLALHCGVQGARTGPNAYLMRNPIHLKDIRADEFGLVILSDYHTYQRLDRNVFYLGSPLQHSFGETHEPRIWGIELTDGDPAYRTQKIYTSLPLFKRVILGEDDKLKSLEHREAELAGNYVRIDLSTDSSISDRNIEDLASGKYLVQIEHKGDHGDAEGGDVRTLSPNEAIRRYVHDSAKKRERSHLEQLGNKIYKGEIH